MSITVELKGRTLDFLTWKQFEEWCASNPGTTLKKVIVDQEVYISRNDYKITLIEVPE